VSNQTLVEIEKKQITDGQITRFLAGDDASRTCYERSYGIDAKGRPATIEILLYSYL